MSARRLFVRSVSSFGLFALALLLASCTKKPPESDPTYTVGGTVSGLAGTGLVLQNNGGNSLAVSANGAFTFSTAVTSGAAYSVTASTQPISPSQTCTVTSGSGTVGSANVTNVAVACVTNTYTIGGNVSGLSGTGLVLQNNGGNNLAVSVDGAFTFTTPIASGSPYAVTVFTQPTNPSQTCTVTNGSGTVGSANVTNVTAACVDNIFRVIDHNGVGVPGVNAYLDGGVVPIGTTDATGSMPRSLTGVHSVDFYRAGYYVTSHVDRNWTAVSDTVTVGATPYPGVTTTGTVSGTISNTAVGDAIRVLSRRSSDGFSSFSFPPAASPSTPYSLSAALVGTSDLFVIPNTTNFPTASSFIGYSPDVAVPSTVNPSLVRSAATSFAVTGTGGFPPPGSIAASYGVTTNRLFAIGSLFTLNSASTSGATLAATTVNVPPLNLAYPNASYWLRVSAFSVPSIFGGPTQPVANFQARYETRGFPTYADMVAAAASPQDITLTDDTLVATGPAHNAINVSLSPSFTWSRVGSPDYVEVRLFEYDPVRAAYVKLVWYSRVYGNTFSVTVPATVTLNPDSFYLYDLDARRDLFDGAGVFAGYQQNGWEDVKFSTGATTPP